MSKEYTIKLSKRSVDLFEASAVEGRFGDTVEDILDQIINNRIHHVEDFRLSAAIGLLKKHYGDGEVLSIIRGNLGQKDRSLKKAKIAYQDEVKRLQTQKGIILKEKKE